MRLKIIVILCLFVVFTGGCATKNLSSRNTIYLIFKADKKYISGEYHKLLPEIEKEARELLTERLEDNGFNVNIINHKKEYSYSKTNYLLKVTIDEFNPGSSWRRFFSKFFVHDKIAEASKLNKISSSTFGREYKLYKSTLSLTSNSQSVTGMFDWDEGCEQLDAELIKEINLAIN
jgi:hypothetical protein